MFSEYSFVKRSGQAWKVWLFLVLMAAGALSMLAGFTIARNQPTRFVAFVLVGTFLVAVGLFWLAIAVECRNCKTRLGWRALNEQSHNGWLVWFFKADACPACKDTGSRPTLSGGDDFD